MRKVTKKNTKQLEEVCRRIRQTLHIDHLERTYEVNGKVYGNSVATTTVSGYGWRLFITLRPSFWKAEFDQQLRYLIHKHIHVALHAYHQATDRVYDNWVPPHCRSQVDEVTRTGAEIAVDHLTEVFYQLIKPRFA